jgi:hypothetical protein
MLRAVCVGIVATCILAMVGCGPKEVPSSGKRSPTSADRVRIYQKAPHRYENLGVVSIAVTPEVRMDDKGDSTLGFERLKAKAAELGANGLLLIVPVTEANANVLAGYKGSFYQVPVRTTGARTAYATAIWVLEE